jgi:molybdenum cofactor cytidylyltransferase
MPTNSAILLLAAGASRRLGSPKPDYIFEGKRLLDWALEAILPLELPTYVIEGAHPITGNLGAAHLLHNKDWGEGIASSIRSGIMALPPEVEQVLICVCDQPYLTTTLLHQILDVKQGSRKGIVACSYGGILGVPVLLSRRYFPDVLALSGDIGARRIVQAHLEDVAAVEFELGAVDVDEPT